MLSLDSYAAINDVKEKTRGGPIPGFDRAIVIASTPHRV